MIVADTNLIIALALKTAATPLAETVWKKDNDWAAPVLWESEFRNAMVVLIRSGAIGEKTALAAFRFAAERIEVFPVSTPAVLRLAEHYKLTGYDAEFAALAEWLDVTAVSLDPDLVEPGLALHPNQF